jgi:alpha-glucosidase
MFALTFGNPERRSWRPPPSVLPSAWNWDGKQLLHPEYGVLLELIEPPSSRPAELRELPELSHRAGDQLPEVDLWQLRLRRQGACFGLGQALGGLRRDPGSYAQWTVDPPWGHHRGLTSMYQAHPCLVECRPDLCLGLWLNTSWFSRCQLKGEEILWECLGPGLELWVLAAGQVSQVCQQLAQLTGQPLRPPSWALGYHQSRWGYRSQAEIEQLAGRFRELDLPLDVIHLDIDYMDGYRTFTFNQQSFPDPSGMAERLQQQGVRLVTILDPGLKCDLHGSYAPARKAVSEGLVLRQPDGSPFTGYCWPDSAVFCDFTLPQARQFWADQVGSLQALGISGMWVDMNEPAIFSAPFSSGFSQPHPPPLALPVGPPDESTSFAEVHNLYGHLMAQATAQGLAGESPWVLTRSACVGTQRFAASWMGDNHSWWEHLAASLPQLMNMGLSGQPWVGVDVGGFFGDCEGELFDRWLEQAVYYPFLRNHSALDTRSQEPWEFGPEVLERARQHLRWRYRLLPYLETLAQWAHERGEPLLRPLFYDFYSDSESYWRDDQAMFGPHLMIAPICKRGQRSRVVYFPPGGWAEVSSGRVIVGPCEQLIEAPLGQMPLFLREGACLPLGNQRNSTSEPLTQVEWWLYPRSQVMSGQALDEQGHWTTFRMGPALWEPGLARSDLVRWWGPLAPRKPH